MGVLQITAHAGCEGTKANSIESIEKAIVSGADIVEVDVRTTLDGVLVLSHDDRLQKKGDSIEIRGNTYKALKAFCQMVTLEEALKLIGHKKRLINMDIKDVKDYDSIHQLVQETGMKEHAIITGCHWRAANAICQIQGHIPVYFSADDDFAKRHPERYKEFMVKTCEDARATGCSGINLDHVDCRKELIDYAHEQGLAVYIWTVDQEEDMRRYLEWGIDGITTNEVIRLVRLLAS